MSDKNIMNWFNGVLFTFLLLMCLAFIGIGSMMYHFQREYRINHDDAVRQRSVMLANDSVTQLKLNAIIKGQISTHETQAREERNSKP